MQEIVADTINDLEFLKLQLTTEIDRINTNIDCLLTYPMVQNYISLEKQTKVFKRNKSYQTRKRTR